MRLTVSQAAILLGVSTRTVRSRIKRGEIPARREGREWVLERKDLPLTEAQRAQVQTRAEEMRAVVDAILPSRLAATSDRRTRSLADLDSFRVLVEVLAAVRASPETSGAAQALPLLEYAAGCVGESSFVFERERKLAALSDARAFLGRAVAALIAANGVPPPSPALEWVVKLEESVQVMLGGYARWVSGLGRPR